MGSDYSPRNATLLDHNVAVDAVSTFIIVVVLTLTHRYNAVRGHRPGSNNSGAEDYLRRKTNKNRG